MLHTAAYWLLHTLRGLAPKRSFWRDAQFDTLRLALIKVAGRVTELASRTLCARTGKPIALSACSQARRRRPAGFGRWGGAPGRDAVS